MQHLNFHHLKKILRMVVVTLHCCFLKEPVYLQE